MFSHVALAMLAMCVGMTHGWGARYRNVTVSQSNFVSIAVDLVTKRYDSLMKEGKALEPATKVCSDKVTKQNDTCMNCIHGITQCGDLSPLEMTLMVMKNPKLLGPLTQKLLKSLGGFMGSTVTKLYNKYGAGPVKVLKKGWNGMAKGFKWIGGNFKSGFSKAFNGMKSLFSKLGGGALSWAKKGWTSIGNIFSGRRRRYDGEENFDDDESDAIQELSELYQPRQRRADEELTPAQKECVKSACPVCTPFIDATDPKADPVDAWRKICGADIINKNIAVEKKATQARKFYALLTGNVTVILQGIEVDTSNGQVAKVFAYTGTMYKEYAPKGILFDLWNQDPAYKKIAEFLMGTH